MNTEQISAAEQTSAARVKSLNRHIFAEPDLKAYAVLDGASVPGLLEQLEEHQPEHTCLYRGEIPQDLAECAPYLVRLNPDAPLTHWILEKGWSKRWGIFALTASDMTELRKHFRTILVVKSPEGKRLYFRYYDPRVLRVYLPTLNAEEIPLLFGPVKAFLCESETDSLLSVRAQEGRIMIQELEKFPAATPEKSYA